MNWDEPEDVQLQIIIRGRNTENLQGRASWNASGRDFSEELGHGTTSFFGQYVRNVTVVSNDPKADFQLEILEGSEQVFESEPIQGIGIFEYNRDVNKTDQGNPMTIPYNPPKQPDG